MQIASMNNVKVFTVKIHQTQTFSPSFVNTKFENPATKESDQLNSQFLRIKVLKLSGA